jgi:hypothetical protein
MAGLVPCVFMHVCKETPHGVMPSSDLSCVYLCSTCMSVSPMKRNVKFEQKGEKEVEKKFIKRINLLFGPTNL